MSVQSLSARPLAIDPPPQPLKGLRWLRTVVRNPMEAWPADVYREPLVIWDVGRRKVAFVMAPDLIREIADLGTHDRSPFWVGRR